MNFSFIIKDELGIHARPAGMLVKEAKKYQSKIYLIKDGKKVDATKLMAVMGLAAKCGQQMELEIEGPDEAAACEAIKTFLESYL